jgi:glycosyltransferase involved in cell wall biosynthesis
LKLLIITHSYSPDLNPRAFRWTAIAMQLARMGHDVHVLCATPGAAMANEGGVIVHRVNDWLLNSLARASQLRAAVTPERAARGLRTWLRTKIRWARRALYWPDYACGWIIPATLAARELRKADHYDWIISVSHPFSGHMVGLLSRAKRPGSRWLVDIGDPFSLMKEPSPNNRYLYTWLNRVIEKRVVARANAISVTTESTRKLYAENFRSVIGRVTVVPPLLSLTAPCGDAERPPGDCAIKLIFVGTLYRKLRSPVFLLKCFSALRAHLPERQLELHFYGSVNDCADELASCPADCRQGVIVHGLVSRAEVLRAMLAADILVNIGNDSETQLASKVIEYMAVGKPILNVTSTPHDASVGALADYPAVLTVKRSEAELTASTLELLSAFVLCPPKVEQAVIEAVRQRYSAEQITGQYASMLE